MLFQNVKRFLCHGDCVQYMLIILSVFHVIQFGTDGHPQGPYPCGFPGIIGSDLTLPLPPFIPAQLVWFRMLNRTSMQMENISECMTPNKTCYNPFPTLYEATFKTENNIDTMSITFYDVQRYLHELTISFRWDEGPLNVLRCVLQVYNFTSDPYCYPPTIVLKESEYFLIYRCGIKDVYPQPFCGFTFVNESQQHEFQDWSENAVIEHGGPVLYDLDCYSEPISLSNKLPTTHQLTFYAAPGIMFGKTEYNKSISLDPAVIDGPNITCVGPRFASSSERVEVVCTMLSYYHNVSCQFMEQLDSGAATLVNDAYVTATNGNCTDEPKGCEFQCVLSKDIQVMNIGNHSFTVTATPFIAGVNDSFQVSASTDSIEIKLPGIHLIDCPIDDSGNPFLSKWGDRVRCQCHLTDSGQPKGYPQWYFPDGTTTGKLIKGVAHLVHLFNDTDTRPSFICRGVSYKGQSHGVNLTIEYAFGPNVVTSGSPSPSPYNLCPSTTPGTGISMQCDVSKEHVRPDANVTVTGSTIGTNAPTSFTNLTQVYRYMFQFNTDTSGTHTVKCVAVNSLYEDLTFSKDTTILVHEPPSSPPQMTRQNGPLSNLEVVSIQEGENFNLDCRVSGGYPEVTSVSLNCLDSLTNNTGTTSSQSLTVDRSFHQEKCVCSANHVTGCYDLTTEIAFSVAFPPEIQQYTIQGQSEEVTVIEGTQVSIECNVQSSPPPPPQAGVNVERSGAMLVADSNESQGLFGRSLIFSKVMSGCLDTGAYTCVGDNGIGSPASKSIQVFVQCQPVLEVPSEDFQTFNTEENGIISVVYSILSNPVPLSVTLSKRDASGSLVQVDSVRYQDITTPGASPPYSNVSLEYPIQTADDRGHYVLNVSNGVGDNLLISFDISIPSNEAQTNDVTTYVSGGLGGAFVFLAFLASVTWCLIQRKKRQLRKDSERVSRRNDYPPTRASTTNDNYSSWYLSSRQR